MVRGVVGVAEGDAIVGDGVLAVLEPPQRRLGLVESGAVLRDAGDAGRQKDDLCEVPGLGRELVDDIVGDDRLGLGRFQGRLGGGGRGHGSLAGHDQLAPAPAVVGRLVLAGGGRRISGESRRRGKRSARCEGDDQCSDGG